MNVRKEYYFIAALLLFVVVLFGFGSKAGLALQASLRGRFAGLPEMGTANLASSLGLAGAPAVPSGGITVPVYSQYPLNIKNQLSIAAGTANGIQAGDIALADGYVIGIVEKAFERSALVQTIFDKRFQVPVKIGASGADALLRGGGEPKLTLIPAQAEVIEGDRVTAAAAGTPYGAPIGSLHNLRESGDRVFREAVLTVPYNAGSLDKVVIVPSSKR